MIEMFKTLSQQHITNSGVYIMFVVLALSVLIITVAAIADKRHSRKLQRASYPTKGMFIGSTHIWL